MPSTASLAHHPNGVDVALLEAMPSSAATSIASANSAPVVSANEGFGPLLQRDYWAVIKDSRLKPSEIMTLVVSRFPEFSPEELTEFKRADGKVEPLTEGVELEIKIRMAGECQVRVLHIDDNSVTLGTLAGHPECGRITFGSYRNDRGDVLFHIRSRARSSAASIYVGFLTLGEPMQTDTWTDFVSRVALTVGSGVLSRVHAETQEIADECEDSSVLKTPTYQAQGD